MGQANSVQIQLDGADCVIPGSRISGKVLVHIVDDSIDAESLDIHLTGKESSYISWTTTSSNGKGTTTHYDSVSDSNERVRFDCPIV